MKYIPPFIISALAVFAPIQSIVFATLVLVFADLITGIFAARKRGEPIRSNGLRRTVVKLCVYLTALCVGFIAENFLLGGSLPVTKLVAGLVGVVELTSLFENLDTIYGGALLKAVIERLVPTSDKSAKP